MSVNSTNPGTLFGGTWKKIEGRFLIGVGKNTDDNNETREIASGQAHGTYSHKLTEAELPSHHHHVAGDPNGKNDNPNYDNPIGWWATSSFTDLPYAFRQGYKYGWVGQTSDSGANHSHNNMPPYLGVYIWKRTA